MGEAVAARPIRAVRAGLAFGVVDAFLVRAADDTVGHDHGASLMLAQEGLDLLADNRAAANIDIFGEPAFEQGGRVAFVGDDRDGQSWWPSPQSGHREQLSQWGSPGVRAGHSSPARKQTVF